MPGKVKVKILAGRNLPVMDRSSDTTDAYVEIKFGNTTYKTDVCRKTLNPKWNTDWYRFEVDDSELQDEPLQIRLMDYDTYSANDAIGKVYLDLNPLLIHGSPVPMKKTCNTDSGPASNTGLKGKGSSLTGWIPVFDTMHGIRGEVNLTVKVELFSDFNKFRQSSCAGGIPHGFHAQVIHGFVEELVVNDDPEYQWIDKIRTPRASNEARQTMFLKLSGELQRKIGLKALDLGGNAVIGYKQCFDLEGDSGIVVRGIGTAVTLIKFLDNALPTDSTEDIVLTVGPQSPRSSAPLPPRAPSPPPLATPTLGRRFPLLSTGRASPVKIWPPELARSASFASKCTIPRALTADPEIFTPVTRLSTQSLNDNSSSPGRFSRSINRLLPSNKKFSLGLNAIKAKIYDETRNLGSLEDIRQRNRRVHVRSSSDSVTSILIRSLMESSIALDRVIEVKESPCSSTSASRRESFINPLTPPILQLTHSDSYIPDETIEVDDEISVGIRYLESNPSSGVSSSSDSSTSDEETESLSTSKEKSPSSSPLPKREDSNPFNFQQDKSETTSSIYVYTPNSLLDTPIIDIPSKQDDNSDNESQISEQRKSLFALKHDFLHGDQLTPSSAHLLVPSSVQKSRSANSLLPTTSPKHDLTVSDRLNSSDVKHALPCLLSLHDRPTCEEVAQPPLPGSPSAIASTATVTATGAIPRISPSPAKLSTVHRRSSDSDLSITPKGNSLSGSDRSSHLRPTNVVRPTMNQENLEMLEYPFLTMSKFPPGFILHIGGSVSTRSVKLLERITNLEEPESRDAWWTELRMEIRGHARALGCNVVLGYSEQTSICEDVCVLSAAGTAALISLKYISAPPDPEGTASTTTNLQSAAPPPLLLDRHPRPTQSQLSKELMTTSLDRNDLEHGKRDGETIYHPGPPRPRHHSESQEETAPPNARPQPPCSVCHIPYSETKIPFQIQLYKCAVCGRGTVPEVLFTTIEVPDGLTTTGHGSLIQAFACRTKKDLRGELLAKEISDSLPFLEYEMHRLLLNKLKVKSMNSIFGLKIQVTIGEKMIVALATGTAVFLNSMPMPPSPLLTPGTSWTDEKKLAEIQKQLQETVRINREILSSPRFHQQEGENQDVTSDTEDSEEEGTSDLDLAFGNKDSYVFEVDDSEDADIAFQLIGPKQPEGFIICNTDYVPGLEDLDYIKNIQMFTQVWRAKVPTNLSSTGAGNYLQHLLQSLCFKLRRMVPCVLANIRFQVELPEQDEMQLSIIGLALSLQDIAERSKSKRKKVAASSSKEPIRKATGDDNDMIFNLEEDPAEQNTPAPAGLSSIIQIGRGIRPRSPLRVRSQPIRQHHAISKDRYGVELSPLSYIPGGRIERYLGNLNFFFIRESTSIREGGALSGFVHSFVTEVLAIVRAHVTALGGNAMVSYFLSECILYHTPHKNQGQCLINVGGDVVHVTYFIDE